MRWSIEHTGKRANRKGTSLDTKHSCCLFPLIPAGRYSRYHPVMGYDAGYFSYGVSEVCVHPRTVQAFGTVTARC